MQNKWFIRVLMAAFAVFMVCGAALAVNITYKTITVGYANIAVTVDGVEITPKDVNGNVTEPFIYNGTTYVPARAISEALGKTVAWDDTDKTVIIGEEDAVKAEVAQREQARQQAAQQPQQTTQPTLTLKHFLEIAMQPVGHTMYVWGGGWNEADTGAGIEAVTMGVSPQWDAFFQKQDSSYNYQNTRYQIHNGLDCSGFVGWSVYNLLNTESGNEGYVMASTKMAQNFADRGWGTYTPASKITKYTPGDIMSTSGHVYIVVGQCADGSVVLVHASPAGVQINGTVTPSGSTSSQAIALATQYMKTYFPEWYAKFPDCTRNANYLTNFNQMTWDISGNRLLTDPDGFAQKDAAQVLAALFSA